MYSVVPLSPHIIVPRLEFPAWVRRIGDPLKMLSPLAGSLTPLGVSGAVQTPLLLDQVTGAAAAYSLRKLRNAYAGSAVRVRRSSDDTEQDIGFSGADFDTSAFSSFIGAGIGYVRTWYDQSGNANNATQTTNSKQPQIVLSAQNGKAIVRFDGTDDALDLTTAFMNYKPITIFAVAKRAAGIEGTIAGYNDGVDYFLALTATIAVFRIAGKSIHVSQSGGFNLWCAKKASTGAHQLGKNGAAYSTAGSDPGFGVRFGRIGLAHGYSPLNGDIPELVAYGSAVSDANRTIAEADINAYYAIY